ncbi:MAG TPA: hypothetical protein PKD91_11780 [Bacteroidia bacterium]|nr:hypothetical protein [Bacteroidia bacterium]
MNSRINKDIFTETGCIKRDLLLRYRDGALSSHEKYEVEKHLVDCPLCTDALDGLMLVTSTASLDDVQNEVSEMVYGNAGTSFQKYWVAAASVAAIVVLSVFTYLQFRDAKDQRMAVTNEAVQTEPVQSNQSYEVDTLADSITSAQPIIEAPPVEILLPKRLAHPEKAAAATDAASNAGAAPVGEFVFEGQGQSYNRDAQSEKELSMSAPPTSVADEQTVPSKSVTQKSSVKDTRGINASSNFITYVDNLKVIDYGTDSNEEEQNLSKDNNTPSKYENKSKKQEAAAAESKSGDAINRKLEYTNLISKPVILFNQGKYESAVKEFDEVLKIHPNDENAIFYKGMSLYHLKNYNQSATLLSTVSRNSASPFAEEATFYVAKSYLGSGELKKAKVLLQDIVKGNGFYAEQAAEELKK